MSWSVMMIGKPKNVAQALKDYAATQTGQCKVEFDAILPHLIGLCEQNFVTPEVAAVNYTEPILKLVANGSGSARGDDQLHRQASVVLEAFWGKLV